MKTTVDIDDSILRDLKLLQQREGKSLGRVVSDLLAQALAGARKAAPEPAAQFQWHSQAMRAKVDLASTNFASSTSCK